MKKLIPLGCKSIILTLFFFSICHSQIIKDVSVYRGDSTRIEFKTNGNITAKGITFVVKLTKSFSSPRLIQKKNTIAGGSSSEIITSYSAPHTKVTVNLGPDDTQDLTGATYYYDIVAADAGALESYSTFNYGIFKVISDVQTPFDGTNLPGSGVRIGTIAIENASSHNSVILWDTTQSYWKPLGLNDFESLLNLSASSVGNADSLGSIPAAGYLLKSDSSIFITPYDLSQATVTLPDSIIYTSELTPYVDKSSTQTITGQKTFSNNKTVFGTTTNDSVIVKGKLDVDGNVSFGQGTNTLTFDPLTLAQDSSVTSFKLYLNEPLFSAEQYGVEINSGGLSLFKISSMYAPDYNPGIISLNGSSVDASDYNWVLSNRYSIYSMNGFRTDGNIIGGEYSKIFLTDTIYAKAVTIDSNYTFPTSDGIANQVLKTNGSGILSWQSDISESGTGTFNPDEVWIDTTSFGEATLSDVVIDSIGKSMTLYKGINEWVNYSAPSVFRLGKSYADRRFNNGAYTNVWMIDYVVPPYNLSSAWLFPIEHRVDYFNDTLQTISSVANLLYIDTVGTGIWRSNDVNISGVETEVSVGDLPDSTTLVWANTGLYGNKIILSESNLTATAKRFPMKVKGYSFDIGTNAYYTYPELYSYYSNLGSGNLEKAYHFYGEGNYPSYFGGNILTDGYIKVQDSIIIGSSTVKIYPDSITIGGTRVAKITEAGSLDTSIVNDLIQDWADTTGVASSYTLSEIDSLLEIVSTNDGIWAAKQDALVSGTNIKTINSTSILGSGNIVIAGGTDTTHLVAFNNVIDLQDSIDDLQSSIETILNEGDVRVPFVWAYLQLDTTGSVTTIYDLRDVAISTLTESDTFAISANDVARVDVDSGSYKVKYDNAGTPTWTGWLTSEAYYKDVDSAIVRHTSGSTNEDTTYQIFYVSNDADTFGVTTVADLSDNTPPAAPTNLFATADNDTAKVRLTWEDPADADLDSIRIYRAVIADTTAYTYLANVDEETQSYTNLSLSENTAYWYKIKAVDDSSNVSEYSNRDSALTFTSAASSYMPDIVYADTSFSAINGTATDTLGFDHWSSIEAGQLILVAVVNEGEATQNFGTGADTVSEAGWTFAKCAFSGSADSNIGLFYKIATGDETGHFTVHAGTTQEMMGWYLVLDSVDTTDPMNVIGDTTLAPQANNPSQITLESETTDADYCLAIGLVAINGTGNFYEPDTMYASNSGWTYYDETTNRKSDFTSGGVIVLKDVPTAGATGTVTVYTGFPENVSQDGIIGFVVAIKGKND